MEVVPAEEKLEQIAPAELVPPTPYTLEQPYRDVLERLLPLRVHLLASEFSEAKATLQRDVVGKVDLRNQELQKALDAMDLNAGTFVEKTVSIPPDVYTKGSLLRDPSRPSPSPRVFV